MMRALSRMVLAACAAILLAATARAGWPPPGMQSHTPWEHQQYMGYKEPHRPAGLTPPATISATPRKYTINVTVLAKNVTHEVPDSAWLVAHVPEDALVWVQDQPTTSTGTVRKFYSPALPKDRELFYTVRVAWVEDGKWVAQTSKFPVHAGDVRCIDILPSDAATVEKESKASLAKLSDEDRTAAEKQGHCVVQEGVRLGSMGVPVKVTLEGTDVFLCCKACLAKAKANPKETLEKAKAPKGKKPAGE